MPATIRRAIVIFLVMDLVAASMMGLQLGGGTYKYLQLISALTGGTLTLFMALVYRARGTEPLVRNERATWILVGIGQVLWGIGEGFWRYYTQLGQNPFPSMADLGYIWFPICCFIALLLQPAADTSGSKRLLIGLDSLIAMGALLAIGWYLLLGQLAQAPSESLLAKYLGLYYPTTDVCLLSCVIFTFLRGQGRYYQATARKISLLLLGTGLLFFSASDFLFNVLNNLGTYVDGSWADMGWALGMLIIGQACYLRFALPVTPEATIDRRMQRQMEKTGFGVIQAIPYLLILLLFTTLTFNVLSMDKGQLSIRPVFILATIVVISLVIVRQILTLRENERLSLLQAQALDQIADQARHIAERNIELESGISHLKAVQTSLANGNLRARAHLQQGMLWSLAGSLNLLAERLMNLGHVSRHLELLRIALQDLTHEMERMRQGYSFQIPASCRAVPEIMPLIHVLSIYRNNQTNNHPPGRVASPALDELKAAPAPTHSEYPLLNSTKEQGNQTRRK